MRDLEPYICTFDDCSHPCKTYGMREAWIQHEVEFHQSHIIWYCRPCATELSTRSSFESHMRKSHPDIADQHQLDLFADICQQSSTEIKSRNRCPLCLEDRRNQKKLHNHLADHLEQIALFAALPLRPEAESEDEFDLMDDSSSEGDMKAPSVFLDFPDDSSADAENREHTLNKYFGDQAGPTVREGDKTQGAGNGQTPQNAGDPWRPEIQFRRFSSIKNPLDTSLPFGMTFCVTGALLGSSMLI